MVERSNYPKSELANALEVLAAGGVILYPTDTIWGLGCDATNKDAVEKLLRIKQRDPDKGLIILIDQDSKLHRYVKAVPEITWDLLDVAVEPLTIVFEGGQNVDPSVLGPGGSIAIRVCKDAFCLELISRLKKPLVSTSANIQGEPTPSNFAAIDHRISQSVDYVVNYRQTEKRMGKASEIISLGGGGEVKILRS